MFMNRKDKEELRLYRTALDWLHFQFSITDFVGMTVTYIRRFKESEKDKALLNVMKKSMRQFNTALRDAEALPSLYAAQKRRHAERVQQAITEWKRGCSVADHRSPWECQTCTIGLIDAIKSLVTEFAEPVPDNMAAVTAAFTLPEFAGFALAPDADLGEKLFNFNTGPLRDRSSRAARRFDETRPFAGLAPAPGRMDGHNPLPDYQRPPTPPGAPRAADKRNTVEISVAELKRLNAIEADAAVPFHDHVTGLPLGEGDVFITSTNYWKALNAASERLTTVEADRDIARDQLKRAEAESRSLLCVAFDASGFCAISLNVLKRYAQFPWAKGVANIDALVTQLDLSLRRQFKVLQPFYAVEAQKEVEDRLQSTIDHSKAEYPT